MSSAVLAQIRDSLNEGTNSDITLASALLTIEQKGAAWMVGHVLAFPEATLTVGTGEPGAGELQGLHTAPLRETLRTYRANPDAIERLIHGSLIQRWNDFLDSAFKCLLQEHFSGQRLCSGVKDLRVTLNLSEDTSDNVLAHVIERAVESFSFKSHMDRLALCERSLGVRVQADTKAVLTKHVIVRNIVQHSGGQVRELDLRRLGVNYLVLCNDRQEEVRLSAGDLVRLSFCDLVDAKETLHEAAAELTK